VRTAGSTAKIEVLIPDFNADEQIIQSLVQHKPEIIAHNVETVPSLYPVVRPQADYAKSLKVIELIKKHDKNILAKSGLMVGFGETKQEVLDVMVDLRHAGCDIITIGQYLRPDKSCLPVTRFVTPTEFDEYKYFGQKMDFSSVIAGPFVRSSYKLMS
jgi:lipoic acid synthetase